MSAFPLRVCVGLAAASFSSAFSLVSAAPEGTPVGKFQQLEQVLPTPNAQRNASGAPGAAYWQNRADHVIEATLDEKEHTITGQETITYHNASPDADRKSTRLNSSH